MTFPDRKFSGAGSYADAYFNRGLVYVAIGQLGKAESDFTQTVEINPELAEAYIHRGNIYVAMNQYEQAIQDFTKALEINPRCTEIYFKRAMACFAQGRYDDAWQDVNEIRKMGLQVPPGFLNNLQKVSGIENK